MSFYGLLAGVGLSSATAADPIPSTNHVLRLNGQDAHAVLPVEPVRQLTQATIECWVSWDDLGNNRRILNYGRPLRDLSLMSRAQDDLVFVISHAQAGLRWLVLPDLIAPGHWMHVAASSGPQGMRLYLNGVPLLPVHPHTGSFADAESDGVFYLGKSVTERDREPTFRGALDEFRIWNYERSAEEIRADLFRRASPGEPGLVLLASFEPGESVVELRAGARISAEAVPTSSEDLATPGTIEGQRPMMVARAGGGGLWRSGSVGISFVAGVLSAFCLMHALLFAFQPSARAHLYFALISGLGAAMSWPLLTMFDVTRHWLPLLAALMLRLFQLLFAPHDKPPARLLVGIAATIGVILIVDALFLSHSGFRVGLISFAAVGIVAVCGVRVVGTAIRAWRARLPGSRSIVYGLGALVALAGFTSEVPLLGGITISQLGVVLFFGATSVHLARTFALASRRLEEQATELAESNHQLRVANQQIDHQRGELAAAKEIADAANTAKSRFLASVSHELRTPLNAIIGYSEMLAEEAPEVGAPSLVRDLERIQTAARHQLTLINDILDLSKIEAGRLEPVLEEFHPVTVIDSVASLVQPLMAKNGNRFKVTCIPALPLMRSDATKLRQILFNLLSNAAKFTERGDVHLEVQALPPAPPRIPDPVAAHAPSRPDGEFLTFAVRDTGIGMSLEEQGRLFQPFSQAEARTHTRYGGTGLGLAISRRFAVMLGGDLAVVSAAGQGSVFTLSLPRNAPAPLVSEGQPPVTSDWTTGLGR